MGGVLNASAYVNHGRWLVDCPRCNAGVKVATAGVRCTDCSAEVVVSWPERDVRERAEKVLGVRPTENRNWYPEREDVDDLKAENLLHGLVI